MTITLSSARILVITQNAYDQEYLEDFFEQMEGLPKPDFVSGTIKRVVDKYDLILFSAHLVGDVGSPADFDKLPEDLKFHFSLLDQCIQNTNKYVVFFGKRYYALNQERCIPANSKFTLFARIRELIDFINHYRATA